MRPALLLLAALAAAPAGAAHGAVSATDGGVLDVELTTDPERLEPGKPARLGIRFLNPTLGGPQEHIDYTVAVYDGSGAAVFGPIPRTHTAAGAVKIPVGPLAAGEHEAVVTVDGILFTPVGPESASFALAVGAAAEPAAPPREPGGGCLVATAAYGTEMAPQVQRLREARQAVAGTASGSAFLGAFSAVYYSFSPAVADLERQSPELRAAVRAAIAPAVWALGAVVGAEGEAEVAAYGSLAIMLAAGAYLGPPAAAAWGCAALRRRGARGRA